MQLCIYSYIPSLVIVQKVILVSKLNEKNNKWGMHAGTNRCLLLVNQKKERDAATVAEAVASNITHLLQNIQLYIDAGYFSISIMAYDGFVICKQSIMDNCSCQMTLVMDPGKVCQQHMLILSNSNPKLKQQPQQHPLESTHRSTPCNTYLCTL